MSLKQRKSSPYWWIDITTPGGKRIRESTKTTNKQQAQEYHDQLNADLWRQGKLGEKPRRTYEEAAVRFLRDKRSKTSYSDMFRDIDLM